MQPNTTCHQICSCKVLTSRGWFNELKNEMQRNARFSDPKIRNEVVLSMMHHITVILEKYRTTMSEEIFKTVHFELFKLVVPMAVNSKGERPNGPHDVVFEPIPWVFSSASIEKLGVLDTPMEGSLVYTKRKVSAKSKAAPSPKPVKKRKATTGLVSQEVVELGEEVMQLEVVQEGAPRKKLWLDDMAGAFQMVIDDHSAKNGHAQLVNNASKQKVLNFAIGTAMQFAMTKEAKLNGKTYTRWSELRVELKRVFFSISPH